MRRREEREEVRERRALRRRWAPFVTDLEVIAALKIARDLNVADVGTHYCTRGEIARVARILRGTCRV